MQKPTYLKPKNVLNTEIQYNQNGGSVFAFILSEGRFAPLNLRQSHHCCKDLCCILSLYKNRITGIQSYKIAFIACASNIQCILHQSCPMKTRNFTLMRNPVI